MNKKTIYLHAGFHKTATSSIQHFLSNNTAALMERGILYPTSAGNNHSIPIYSQFCDIPGNYDIHIMGGRSRKEINDYNNRARSGLISDMRNNEYRKLLLSGEDIGLLSIDGMNRFRDFLLINNPGAQIKIICFVREIISFKSAETQQRLKDGNTRQATLQYEGNVYKGRLTKLISVFGRGNISVYSFEDACADPDGPVGYFIKLLDLSELVTPELRKNRQNPSISYHAGHLIGYINQQLPFRFGSYGFGSYVRAGRSFGDIKPLLEIRGEKYRISRQEAGDILNAYRKDIVWLKKNFRIDYTATPEEMTEPRLEFDQDYFEDIVTSFPLLSEVIKCLVYEYICSVINDPFFSGSMAIQRDILNYIEKNYPHVCDRHFTYYISQEEKEQKSLLGLKNILSISMDTPTANVYREIALFLEVHDQLQGAAFCMEKALKHRPGGKFIKRKLKEYRDLLKAKTSLDKTP